MSLTNPQPPTTNPLTIGVLAVQGDFAEHAAMLRRAASDRQMPLQVVEVRTPRDLEGIDGLIVPGGESTTIGNLMRMCAITMPVALDKKRMPVGLQLMAPGDHDERLLGIALGFERVLGDGRRRIGRPPMCR